MFAAYLKNWPSFPKAKTSPPRFGAGSPALAFGVHSTRLSINVLWLSAFLASRVIAQQLSFASPVASTQAHPVALYFEENRGQADSAVKFLASNGAMKAAVVDGGVVFPLGGHSISMQIVGAASTGFVVEYPVNGASNYYLGARAITGLPHYSRIRAPNVMPGIDIVYYGNGSELEYDFVARPSADLAAVRLRFSGAGKPELEANGDLLLRAGAEIRLQKLEAWQEIDGQRHIVPCSYQVSDDGEVRFILGQYDHSLELTIDPIINFSTFLSSSGNDSINGIAVDSTGVYVTGSSYTTDFPVTSGTNQGEPALFVTKFNLGGTNLIYSTIIAGGQGKAIVADGAGNVYVAGIAGTDFGNTMIESGEHIFVAKLGPSGATEYETVLAGNVAEDGQAIAIDSTGAAYVAGVTYSSIFPTTPLALRTTLSGTADGVVAKFTPSGQVAYATYLGGNSDDSATGIAVDAQGNAYVTGWTRSSDFPTTSGAYSTTSKGGADAFVSVLNPTGTALLRSTLLGGSADDWGSGITLDHLGNIYVTGETESGDFPATFKAKSGGPAVFVAKFTASLSSSSLQYSAYIGETGWNLFLPAMAVDQSGSAYVAAYASLSAPITSGGFDSGFYGNIYLAQLAPSGDALSYGGRFGGGSGDQVNAIAIDGKGGVYLAGETTGPSFPTTPGAFQQVDQTKSLNSNVGSGVVVKVDLTSQTLCMTSLGPTPGEIPGNGGTFAFNFTLPARCPWSVWPDTQGVAVTGTALGLSDGSTLSASGTVPPNPSTSQRTINIYVAEQIVPITQAAASCKQPLVSPLPLALGASGTTQNVNVSLPNICNWQVSTDAPWLIIGNTGIENGNRTITIAAPPFSYSQRSGTITIDNQTFSVTQTGSQSCTAAASASLPRVPNSGGTGDISVSVGGGSCAWTGYSLAPWIQLAATASGQGNGSLPYIVAANPGSLPRSGQIMVADQFVTITQTAGPAGIVTGYNISVFAGGTDLNSDGEPATEAQIGDPSSVYFDWQNGNFYFSDSQLQRIRIITPDGIINSLPVSEPLTQPNAITLDPSGVVYVGEPGLVFGIGSSFVAGTGTYGYGGDNGPAASAEVSDVRGLAADSSHVYISDTANGRVRSVSGGTITTLAGGLTGPRGITLDGSGNVVFADGNSIRTVSQGVVGTLPISGGSLSLPQDLAYDVAGNLFIREFGGQLLKRSPDSSLSAIPLPLNVTPDSLTTDPSANIYLGDSGNYVIWKLSPVTFCSYTVSQPSIQPPGGGPINLSVTAGAGCNWTAISGLSWVAVSSGSSGTSAGAVQLTIAPNSGVTRSGVVAIAGQAVVITQLAVPSLSVAKKHFGIFNQGQQNATYTVMVSNAANTSATSGQVTVSETAPPGLTLLSMSGSGWSCSTSTSSCSRSDALPSGGSYPPITVTASVSSSATSPQVNVVSASGGGSVTASATDSATIAAPGVTDLALNGSAAQSSTLYSGLTDASKAVDGNTDGSFWDGSVSHTNQDANPWWQVDLGGSATVSSIVVWNRTDCCGNRLSDYWVFVSDTPFGPTDTPATLQSRAGTWSSHQTVPPNPSAAITITGAQGRYVRVQLSGTNYLSLAEVQVLGAPVSSPTQDLALGKAATQSSTLYPATAASKAVDGNTDGNFWDASVSHTNLDANAWWQVDLGASATVSSIVVWNRTDCCGDRLSDYWVFVSDTPFGPADTPATLQSRAGTWSSHQTTPPNPSASIAIAGAQGRYVRAQLSGTNYLSLAEVQVFGTLSGPAPQDLAVNKAASQSSTLYPGKTDASKAVDGNTDGNFWDGSVSHTNQDANAWWEVDLGASATVSSIVVWNRTDCCGDRLSDYWVFVSDTPFASNDTPATLQNRAGTWSSHQTVEPSPSAAIAVTGEGRYVRVQLSGTNYLSLAEVQVLGTPASPVAPDLAVNKAATQSSTYERGFTDASKAVDGNTDGNFGDGSVSHTNMDANAWWQVDLSASATLTSIVIWNRTDCCGSRLSDYWVFVSNTPFGATDTPSTLQNRPGTWSAHLTNEPNPSTGLILPSAQGRYVRVQLSGTDYLSLAEVQVFGQ